MLSFFSFQLSLNIHSQTANYETAFGHVQMPTHKITSWDIAKVSVLTVPRLSARWLKED